MKFSSVLGEVELTEERKKHIFAFHPEVKHYTKYFTKTLKNPKFIRRSNSDPKVSIFYLEIPQNKYLAIVTRINERKFILTAYTTRKIKYI